MGPGGVVKTLAADLYERNHTLCWTVGDWIAAADCCVPTDLSALITLITEADLWDVEATMASSGMDDRFLSNGRPTLQGVLYATAVDAVVEGALALIE